MCCYDVVDVPTQAGENLLEEFCLLDSHGAQRVGRQRSLKFHKKLIEKIRHRRQLQFLGLGVGVAIVGFAL